MGLGWVVFLDCVGVFDYYGCLLDLCCVLNLVDVLDVW